MKKTLTITLAVLGVLLFAGVAKADFHVWEAYTDETDTYIRFYYNTETMRFYGYYEYNGDEYYLGCDGVAVLEGGTVLTAEGTFATPYPEPVNIGIWKGIFILGGACFSDYGDFDGYWCWPSDPPGCEEFEGESPPGPVSFPAIPYLIIYADIFDGNTDLDDFAEWKREKGFDVEMVKMGNINGVTLNDNTSDVDAIRDSILGWYNPNWILPGYVLLVGDAPDYERLPPDTIINGNDTSYHDRAYGPPLEWADNAHIPTCFYGPQDTATQFNFSDDYYKLLAGNDEYPDVALGRWCVEDGDDLAAYIEKTFAYERFPNPNWNPDKALFAACYTSAEGGECGNYDSTKVYIHTEILPDSFEVCRQYADSGGTNAGVKNAIQSNGGVGIVNYRGHGHKWKWNGWDADSTSLTTSDVDSLDQSSFDGYPIVYNVCCWNGCFADPDTVSMVEAWTRNPDGGGVGALGACRTSSHKCGDTLDVGIFFAHFELNYDCGRAINYGKQWIIDSLGVRNTLEARAFNWIGDPELDVWRGTPHDAEISGQVVDNTYLITVLRSNDNAPVSNTQVCMYSKGVCHLVAYTDANGQVSFPYYSEPGIYHFTASNQIGPICIRPDTYSYTIPSQSPSTEIDEKPTENYEWLLSPIGPNPVTDIATISYSVGNAASLDLCVYDATGRVVNTLASGEHASGQYQVTWDGNDASGAECSAGVYFVRMESTQFQANQRIVLIR